MGVENQAATKQETAPAESKTSFPDVVDYQKPSLAGAEVAWNLATVTADRPSEKTATTAAPAGYDWRSSMQEVTVSLNKLDKMSVGDPARAALIEEVDKHFQQSLPELRANATNADARLIVGVVQAEKAEERLTALLADTEVAGVLKQLNLEPNKLNADDVRNAILNATTDSARAKFTEILTLGQMQAYAGARADEAFWAQAVPVVATLEYAEFLMRYKNGVTKDKQGEVFSAIDVLNTVPAEQLLARTENRTVQAAADNNGEVRQAEVVPREKNPLVTLAESKAAVANAEELIRTQPSAEQAIRMQSAAEQLIKAQYAVDQANDKMFDPEEIQKKIIALKSSGDDSPAAMAQIAAWQELSHARGSAEIWLAYQMAQQEKPDHKAILEHIEKAKKDPEAVQSLQLDGMPLYKILEARVRGAIEYEFHTASQQINDKFVKEYTAAVEATDAMNQAFKDGNEKQAKVLIDRGYEAAQRALLHAHELKEQLKSHPVKMDPEKEKLVQQYESRALLQIAQFDMMKGNPDMALLHSKNLSESDNEDIRSAAAELRKAAQEASDYEHAGFFEKRWEDLKSMPGAVWNWIKNNGRIVGMIAGFAAAIAITVGTGGLGAPAGVAIVAGIVGGGVVGTVAGASCEVASGQKKNFWEAAKDVAPHAFTGSIAGATLVGLPGAAAAGTGTARFASILGAQGSSKLVIPVINAAARPVLYNSVRGGIVWGASGVAYNTGRVRDGYAAKKYEGVGDALRDFGAGEAEFIGNGMLFGGAKGKAFLGLSLAKNAAVEGFKPHSDVSSFAKNVAFQTGDDYLGRGFGAITHRVPGLKNIPVLTDPFVRMKLADGQTRQIVGVTNGAITGNYSDLSDADRKQLHLPPAPKGPDFPNASGKPGEPAKGPAKDVKGAFDEKTGTIDFSEIFDEKNK